MNFNNRYKIPAFIFSLLLLTIPLIYLDRFSTSLFITKRTATLLDRSVLNYNVYDPIIGFKSKNKLIIKNATKPKIILLGDSIAYGYAHESEDQIANLIQGMAPDVEFINLAGVGFNSVQAYLNYILNEELLNDVVSVVWINGPNDPRENMTLEFHIKRPEIRIQNQFYCITNYPSQRHPHFFRNPHLNTGTISSISLTLLPELLQDLSEKFYRPRLFYEVLRDSMLKPCSDQFNNPNGVEVMTYLNSLLKKRLEKNGIPFLAVLLPYKNLYSQIKGEETKEIEKALNKFEIRTLDMTPILNENLNDNEIFYTHLKDPDDHFSVKSHKIISESICRDFLKEYCF